MKYLSTLCGKTVWTRYLNIPNTLKEKSLNSTKYKYIHTQIQIFSIKTSELVQLLHWLNNVISEFLLKNIQEANTNV